MPTLRDLKKDYQTYIEACLAAKTTPLHFNGWVQAKISEHEQRIEKLELINKDDGK